MTHQEQYDDAMFEYSMGNYDDAISKLQEILQAEENHFEALLALAMCFYRKGDYSTAIEHGHKAEALNPKDQLVHTNLSLFYVKLGDKQKAEHHGVQARIASWRGNAGKPGPQGGEAVPQAKPVPPAMPPAEQQS